MSNLDDETSSNDTISIISNDGEEEDEDYKEDEYNSDGEDNDEEADNDDDKEEDNDNREADNNNEEEDSIQPTTSDVWDIVDRKTRKCSSCDKTFEKKTGTSSIRSHLQSHGILLIKEQQTTLDGFVKRGVS